MGWQVVLEDIISGIVVAIVTGLGGLLVGIAKGKKKSSNAIERKNKIYQPLVDEISQYSNYKWEILKNVSMPILEECVQNKYKYGFNKDVLKKMQHLYNLQKSYQKIRILQIAQDIVVRIFKKGYEELYGSIFDGVVTHTTPDGDEWDEKIIAEPVLCIEHSNYSKELEDLIRHEGEYNGEVFLDGDMEGCSELIYLQLVRVYSLALNVRVNGKMCKLPQIKINISMLPEEYIAYKYDFFKEFNNNKRIIEKYKLREEIIKISREIENELKDIIARIVKLYEVEQI